MDVKKMPRYEKEFRSDLNRLAELVREKHRIDLVEIQYAFNCGQSKAYNLIRAVDKICSDIQKIRGAVLEFTP